ncbi:ribosome biogenesis protein SLX9 homolog isoform X1 [Lepisosteus oculatus]|uniref:ribosome biogenesis protein SLX9 homolog isoform X1 n=1 Tax=Lepisosteus oculatus TaxID=7918 RepID=UPI0035F5071F
MVGKIKRARQKLHQEAVKLQHERSSFLIQEKKQTPVAAGVLKLSKPESEETLKTAVVNASSDEKPMKDKEEVGRWDVFSSSVFAGMKISPEDLVQTLKVDDTCNSVSSQKGVEEKKQISKKEKMKQRRDRWLGKIGAIKLAREQQKAQAKRRATPVVGDMQPLADALPELPKLMTSCRAQASRKSKVPVKKKPEPTDFSQMKPAQKRKLLEDETSKFTEVLSNTGFKVNPFEAIGEHFRKRLKQEEEENPN